MDFKNCFKEFPGAVTISDAEGKILYMNDASAKVNEKQGGGASLSLSSDDS